MFLSKSAFPSLEMSLILCLGKGSHQTRSTRLEPHAHRSHLACGHIAVVGTVIPVSLWQASGSRVAETRDVMFPLSKRLLLFLFIARFLSPFLEFLYWLYFCSVCLPLTPPLHFFFLLFYYFSPLFLCRRINECSRK